MPQYPDQGREKIVPDFSDHDLSSYAFEFLRRGQQYRREYEALASRATAFGREEHAAFAQRWGLRFCR